MLTFHLNKYFCSGLLLLFNRLCVTQAYTTANMVGDGLTLVSVQNAGLKLAVCVNLVLTQYILCFDTIQC